ncbi:DUF488 domain-containing protein [bacterium AH-315-M05]|nr:DUF488 domain-containing protein [bacterium AH-315-M05]
MKTIKTICTIGYEGKSIDEFINSLKEQKVDILIDARIRANSRKPGFAKTKLKNILERNEIVYEHHKSLGTPKYLMQAMKEKGHYSMEEYGSYLDNNPEILENFIRAVKTPKIALMCYEKDVTSCHRSVVAARLSKMVNANVIHL